MSKVNLLLDRLKILEIDLRTTILSPTQLIDIRGRLSHMLDIAVHLANEAVKKEIKEELE